MYLLIHVPLSAARGGSSLSCENIDAGDAVLAGDALLARAAEGVELLAHRHVTETGLRENRDELSLRESAGNSTRPEIDILADRLRQLIRHHDIRVEEPAAGLEHAEDLAEGDRLVGGEVQDAVGDDHVGARVLERQRHRVAKADFDVVE